MSKDELMRHLMVDHRLDVGRLPNPKLEELQSMHNNQAHHIHAESYDAVPLGGTRVVGPL